MHPGRRGCVGAGASPVPHHCHDHHRHTTFLPALGQEQAWFHCCTVVPITWAGRGGISRGILASSPITLEGNTVQWKPGPSSCSSPCDEKPDNPGMGGRGVQKLLVPQGRVVSPGMAPVLVHLSTVFHALPPLSWLFEKAQRPLGQGQTLILSQTGISPVHV